MGKHTPKEGGRNKPTARCCIIMRHITLIATLLAFVGVTFAAECHPQCKWQCDDPKCPAVCHPVCERPKCQMQCEKTPCAVCTVHCQKPVCTIRCPKHTCEKDSCPKCQSVCKPAQCHTTCKAPKPKCAPVCEALNCKNKCVKPTNCAKPKCELQCEKPACEHKESKCCPCSNVAHARTAVVSASGSCGSKCPSFLETYHTFHLRRQQGKSNCCPCGKEAQAEEAHEEEE